MSFADRLRISRKEKGLSQEQLAELLEVSRQSITKWETGTAYPELRKMLQLSVVMGKRLDWLLWEERSSLERSREAYEESLSADRRYVIVGYRMFALTTVTDPETGEQKERYTEITAEEGLDVLARCMQEIVGGIRSDER